LADICKEKEYRWLLTQCLYGLAHANASENEVSRAIEYSEQALARFEKLGDLNGILKCLSQLADLNQLLKRVERSLGYLSRGLSLAAEIRPEPMQMWGLLVQMAFSMRAMELHKAALFYQMEALHVALEMGRPLIISRSHGYLGATYAMLKMYLEAVKEATKAFETGQNVSDSGGLEIMANASLQLGDIHRQAGNCDQAIEAYSSSIQLYGTFSYYSYVAHKGKLLCYIAGSNYGAVREELETVMGLSESYRKKITTESARVSFFDMEQSVFDLAIQFEFVTMKDPVRAFNYSELSRARSLRDALHLKAEVLMKSYGPDLRLPTVTNSMPLRELQEKMPEGAQILQYAVLDDRLIMWIVTKAGIHHVEVGVGSQLLTQKVRDYLATMNRPPSGEPSDYFARAEDLYRILVVPAEPFLDKSKFLCVVPDKILHYLPYGALVSPATNKFLIEDYDVGTAPNSSIFANLSAVAKVKGGPMEEKLLSVGNPTFDKTAFESLRDLPSATREARAVARFYPKHRLVLSDDAREETIRFEIQNADVIHLAMHYVINENSAMLSGFPLTPERPATTGHEDVDGFLQSYEVYMMDLPRARLVVLSACQTGIEQQYRGEGAISAARPFLVARVPTVVASLWPVDSDSSAQVMTSFHRHRIRNRLSTTKALKQAQIEMARGDDVRYRHPYYWASFLAIGGQSSY
jgi:CHAT domain-containing protein